MTVTINGAAPTSGQQADIRSAIGLGTAATTDATAYATSAQGAKADTALQRPVAQPAGIDSGTWYDTGGTGGPLWVYENARSAINPQTIANSAHIQRIVFIDPVSGNDANDGTFASPKKTRRISLWTGGLTGLAAHYACLFKRGTTYTHDDLSAGIDIGANQHVGSYGPISDPRPVLRSLNTASVPYVVSTVSRGASISDCDINASDVANRSGLVIAGDGTGDIYGVQARNMRITGVSNSGTSLRAGVRVVNNSQGLATNATIYYLAYDIDLINIDVEGVGYHGFHTAGAVGKQVSGLWRSVRFLGCRAIGCSTTYDGHGFSAFAMGTVRDVQVPWTLVTGTRYYCTTAQLFGGASGSGGAAGCTSVPDVPILYQRVTSPAIQTFRCRKNTTSSASLVAGEFFFDLAAQRIYIDVGVALPTTATAGWLTDACTQRTDGILYDRCLAKGTVWPAATAVQEGHGFAADDMTSNALFMNCESINNAGAGISLNRGENNWIINNRLVNNTKGAIAGVGTGHRIWGNIGKGSGLSTYSTFGSGLVMIIPPVYPFADSPVICGGWRLLEYTGTDSSAYLVIGNPDYSAQSVRFEDSVIVPGVAKINGYGAGAGEGGYVLARNLVSPSEAWRIGVAPNHVGY